MFLLINIDEMFKMEGRERLLTERFVEPGEGDSDIMEGGGKMGMGDEES